MACGWHGVGDFIWEDDNLEEAALIGLTRDDPIAGTDEFGEGMGGCDGGHAREALISVTMYAIDLENGFGWAEGGW